MPRAPRRPRGPATRKARFERGIPSPLLEEVRAVRADAEDVLEEPFVVGEAGCELRLPELQPHAAELRRAPVDHRGGPLRVEARRREERGVRPEVDRARAQAVVAQARAPERHELVDALHVSAALPRRIARDARRGRVAQAREPEIALLAAPQI